MIHLIKVDSVFWYPGIFMYDSSGCQFIGQVLYWIVEYKNNNNRWLILLMNKLVIFLLI
jgi:hypothetical protein